MRISFLSSMRRFVPPSQQGGSSQQASTAKPPPPIHPNELCCVVEKSIAIDSNFRSSQQPPPRNRNYMFWPLSTTKIGTKSPDLDSCGVNSNASTPDSSRSVSFDDAISWPWIDDEIDEEGCVN